MSVDPLKQRALLVDARDRGALVRVERSVESGFANGFVVDVGRDLFALCLVGDTIVFNGFQTFRLVDVTRIQSPAPHADFVQRALALRGEHRPANPTVDLSTIERLLLSASSEFRVIAVHSEVADPGVCFIGSVERVTKGRVTLRTINPDARWDDERETISLAGITRVDFGGLYESALLLVNSAG